MSSPCWWTAAETRQATTAKEQTFRGDRSPRGSIRGAAAWYRAPRMPSAIVQDGQRRNNGAGYTIGTLASLPRKLRSVPQKTRKQSKQQPVLCPCHEQSTRNSFNLRDDGTALGALLLQPTFRHLMPIRRWRGLPASACSFLCPCPCSCSPSSSYAFFLPPCLGGMSRRLSLSWRSQPARRKHRSNVRVIRVRQRVQLRRRERVSPSFERPFWCKIFRAESTTAQKGRSEAREESDALQLHHGPFISLKQRDVQAATRANEPLTMKQVDPGSFGVQSAWTGALPSRHEPQRGPLAPFLPSSTAQA